MYLPFSFSMFLGILSPRKVSFGITFTNLYVPVLTPRPHCNEAALQVAENTRFVLLCCVCRGIVCDQPKISSRCCGGIIYIQTVQSWGKEIALRHPCRSYSGHRKFTFYRDFEFSLGERRRLTIFTRK
jgi:hypothetical protein